MKKGNKKDNLLQSIVQPIIPPHFTFRDSLQVIIGASILAVPVGFTEETWRLGEVLPMSNILGLIALSLVFITAFTHYQYHRHAPREHYDQFLKRIAFTYIYSFIVVAIILTLIQKAPWHTDIILAIKRIVIVAFPSSLSGAIADTLR